MTLTLCAWFVSAVYSCRIYSVPIVFRNQRAGQQALVSTLVLPYTKAEIFPERRKVTLDAPLLKDSFE